MGTNDTVVHRFVTISEGQTHGSNLLVSVGRVELSDRDIERKKTIHRQLSGFGVSASNRSR